MADTYWRECPLDPSHLGGRHSNEHVCLPCGNDYLVPVVGALLIEDVEAAAHRARIELQINLIGEQEGSESLGESFEMVLLKLGWEGMLIRLLRAAAGERER